MTGLYNQLRSNQFELQNLQIRMRLLKVNIFIFDKIRVVSNLEFCSFMANNQHLPHVLSNKFEKFADFVDILRYAFDVFVSI